jgi:myosin heavy subunit
MEIPGGKIIQKPAPPEHCVTLIKGFAKSIYSKLFTWIVKYINLSLMPDADRQAGTDPTNKYAKIGLLDIFGFEIFPEGNSIEQLCINFTNEKLHQLYIEYVFKLEEVVFIEEGLGDMLANLHFEDNQALLDLISDKGRMTIFGLLDDETQVTAKDEKF